VFHSVRTVENGTIQHSCADLMHLDALNAMDLTTLSITEINGTVRKI